MSRIRSIKPEFCVSEQLAECSPSARLLFILMWMFCDDFGNHPASPRQLKMECFPADEIPVKEIVRYVDQLISVGLLDPYIGEDGRQYWHVTGWHHQKIDKPTRKYPPYNSASAQRGLAEDSPSTRRALATETSRVEDETSLPSVVAVVPRTTAVGSEPGETTPSPDSSPAPTQVRKGNGQDHDPPHKPKPRAPPKPKPIEFDPTRIDWQGITDAHVAAWEEAYPACNLRAELAKAAVWASANPANRKSNWERFLTNWLSRSQDNAQPRRTP